jgi:hypothetical protein
MHYEHPKRGIQHEKLLLKKNPQNRIQVKMWLKYFGYFLKNWENNSQKTGNM